MKMRLRVRSVSMSFTARGSRSFTKCLIMRLNVSSHGMSRQAPPTRVQSGWKRWPLMYSTMS